MEASNEPFCSSEGSYGQLEGRLVTIVDCIPAVHIEARAEAITEEENRRQVQSWISKERLSAVPVLGCSRRWKEDVTDSEFFGNCQEICLSSSLPPLWCLHLFFFCFLYSLSLILSGPLLTIFHVSILESVFMWPCNTNTQVNQNHPVWRGRLVVLETCP